MKKTTVTIGIPSYNEQTNIGRLIESVLDQKGDSYVLKSVIVISDKSSDKTFGNAKKYESALVRVFENAKRIGKPATLNKLIKKVHTDVFVQLDGDILIRDTHMIEKLITPITSGKADLTSAKVKEYWPRTLFERVLKISMLMKKEVFEDINSGDNIYTCHGRARAFSKELYGKIYFDPSIVAEDAFSYLFTISNGFKYRFAKNACVYYKLPAHITDHEKQSVRFINSYKQLEGAFGKALISKETILPKGIMINAMIKYFIKYPLTMIIYIGILLLMKKRSKRKTKNVATWSVATSSKQFN